jgi:beta-glucosidase
VPLEVVDRAVRRVLFAKFRLGLFDAPFVEPDKAANAFRTAAHLEAVA